MGVPFGGFVDILPYLGYQMSQKFQFGGMKTFSSQTRHILKLSYYQNYYINCNQHLQNEKDRQVLYAGGTNKPQTNLTWQMAAIFKN